MDYPMNDTYEEKEMASYRAARLYIQSALLDEAKKTNNLEVVSFVNGFMKLHGDINVEVH